MVLQFQRTLQEALEHIRFAGTHHEFPLQDEERQRTEETIPIYGDAKWAIVDLVNNEYSQVLENSSDLYNWLNYNESDELAYFLNEAGSNALNYSEFKAPSKFHLWLGKQGFVVGIEQKGMGFNAQEVNEKLIRENEGAAFEFFRNCKSTIFFDNPSNARIIFMEWKA